MGSPGDSGGKKSTCNVKDSGSILGAGDRLEKETGSPLLYSCLEHPMDRGAWRATAHGMAQSQT